MYKRRRPQAKRTGFLRSLVDLLSGGGESEVVPGGGVVDDGVEGDAGCGVGIA